MLFRSREEDNSIDPMLEEVEEVVHKDQNDVIPEEAKEDFHEDHDGNAHRNIEEHVVVESEDDSIIDLVSEEEENAHEEQIDDENTHNQEQNVIEREVENSMDGKHAVNLEGKKSNDGTSDDEDVQIVTSSEVYTIDSDHDSDDDDLQVMGHTGDTALVDFRHPREHCVTKPFAKDPKLFCPKCFCYVCEVPASECIKWLDGNHCKAQRSKPYWRNAKSADKRRRNAHVLIAKELSCSIEQTDFSQRRVTRSSSTRIG